MLINLLIRDIVLIDRLDLEIERGLTILTGETGAGKSILLDAFALALGARGDGALVRQGEPQGQVTAVFDLDAGHPALLAVKAHDIETDGGLILRRIQMADGRTRAFVNDQPVSAQALRNVAHELVEIHGQHDDRALVDPATHRQLVDAYGRLSSQVNDTREAFKRWRSLKAELAGEEERIAKVRADSDYLRHACAELEKLSAKPGEEAELAGRRLGMMQSEKVASELKDAYDTIAGEGSPIAILSSVYRRLERRQPQAPHLIDPSLTALEEAVNAVERAGQILEQALRDADFDPRDLEQAEERLFALRAAARKYATETDGLGALAEKFSADLADLDAGEAKLVSLAKAVDEAGQTYMKRAATLSEARQKAARGLDRAVEAELAPLKLEGARFLTQFKPETPGPEGVDQVEFWVQTNPGTRPGPLLKVASGGELARFMLALKVVLADRGSAPTLVFDEIDTGVGGAVADAIGQRLARLGSRVQVLAVTHAPQVAARAERHFKISKAAVKGGKRVATRVARLEAEARREEIARMLSGATITDEARAAARRLMESPD